MKARLISQEEYDTTFKDEPEINKRLVDLGLQYLDKPFYLIRVKKIYKNGEVVKCLEHL